MCLSCASLQNYDQAKADAFASRLMGFMNGAALAIMTSIGHRTGLFDALADGRWVTSHELALKAELSERYVREWLGAMSTGQITEYDAESNRYRLPPEHAAWLTRDAAPNNLAASMQWFGLMGGVESKVVDAFGHGRGIPYSAYERFNEVMAEESAQTVVAALDPHILPLVEGLVQRLEAGIDVIDVGCGRGRAMMHLAKRFPNSRFNGLDFLESAVDEANYDAQRLGLSNLTFKQGDAAAWDEAGRYDLVTTFDAVHDQARPDRVLANIRRALKPGGLYLMQDIQGTSRVDGDMDHPMAPFIYTISCVHCMSVSLANNGMGLGAAWGKSVALKMLNEAGFADVEVKTLPHDVQNFYYLCRT